MRLMEKCWCKDMNKLVERETSSHSYIKIGAELKEKFLLKGFVALLPFFVSLISLSLLRINQFWKSFKTLKVSYYNQSVFLMWPMMVCRQ